MLRYLILPVLILLFFTVKANFPPDFTLTATNGVEYNLYSELAKNKPVVLVFFGIYCSSCQTAVPTIETVWQRDAMLGEKGWVWAFETGNVSNQQIEEFMETYGASYIVFRTSYSDSILSEQYGYNINYTPQYYVICSDLSYKTCTSDNVSEVFQGCSSVDIENTEQQNIVLEIQNNNMFITGLQIGKQSKITIIDVLGRMITQVEYRGENNQIVLNKPSLPGLYILNLQTDNNKTISKKLLITN